MSQNITPAAQILISVIPITGIVMGSVVIFFSLLWRHRQIMKQIETGTFQRRSFSIKLFSLIAGALLTGIGAALSILFLLADGLSYALLGGLIPLSAGTAFLCVYRKLASSCRNDSPEN